jgi:phosphoglycolate phosphatase
MGLLRNLLTFGWLRRTRNQPAVIFDFDGTLADSFPLVVDIFYKLVERKPLPRADVTRLRGMTLRQVARELRIPIWRVPLLVVRGRAAMRARMEEVVIMDDMIPAVKRLAKTHKLFILSSNSPETIRAVLKRYGLFEYFTDIEGDVSLLRKAGRLKRLIKRNDLDRRHLYYVGDEARDIEAARRAGVRCIAVSWGYNNIHALKRHHPYRLVFSAEEMLTSLYDNS